MVFVCAVALNLAVYLMLTFCLRGREIKQEVSLCNFIVENLRDEQQAGGKINSVDTSRCLRALAYPCKTIVASVSEKISMYL